MTLEDQRVQVVRLLPVEAVEPEVIHHDEVGREVEAEGDLEAVVGTPWLSSRRSRSARLKRTECSANGDSFLYAFLAQSALPTIAIVSLTRNMSGSHIQSRGNSSNP